MRRGVLDISVYFLRCFSFRCTVTTMRVAMALASFGTRGSRRWYQISSDTTMYVLILEK